MTVQYTGFTVSTQIVFLADYYIILKVKKVKVKLKVKVCVLTIVLLTSLGIRKKSVKSTNPTLKKYC